MGNSEQETASLDRKAKLLRKEIGIWKGGAVILVAVGLAVLTWLVSARIQQLTAFEFGDATGTVGVLWSLAALLLVYVAFLGQR